MAKLSNILFGVEGGMLMFECPGCGEPHSILVGTGPGARWGWNNNVEKPTFTPSILVRGVVPLTEAQHSDWQEGLELPTPRQFVCHSFVRDGNIEFLADCTHSLAGMTVPIPPWRDW
jgi:Family of unknown function (DUF6527)